MFGLSLILCLLLKLLASLAWKQSSKTLQVVYDHKSQMKYLQHTPVASDYVNKNNNMLKYEDYYEDDVCQRLYLQYYYTLLDEVLIIVANSSNIAIILKCSTLLRLFRPFLCINFIYNYLAGCWVLESYFNRYKNA